jgi:ribosomal protein L16 Arg81 hydroxylase
MRDDRSILERILDPLDEATFFRDYWNRKPLVMPAVDRTRFDGLFDLTDLEKYLFIVRPPAGDLRIVRSGQLPPMALVSSLLEERSYDFQAVFNGLSEGFTVVLNAIHARWPEARRLTMALEDRLQARVQANVYITGQRGQGFAIHQDDHDVFVLQTCGTKRWMVYDRPAGPLAGAQPAVLHEIELKTGDALYLPIGYPHAAETADDYSIHVSVGVFPWTWQDLARDCLDLLAAEDPRWQERVPLAVLRGEADPPPAAEIEGRLREGFSKLTDLSRIIERHRRVVGATGARRNPPPSGYGESVRALDRLDVTSEVERRPGVGCYVSVDGKSAFIHFMGEPIRAPISAEKALRFIAAHTRFRISEIDDALLDQSKVVLVRRLIREGLLQRAEDHSTRV